ncbi:MAG TPA: formyltransferase family protein, partial [Patescibacteria group bacterium]|nr:formyltransferase family protein [Patescibacteria group bacterium]
MVRCRKRNTAILLITCPERKGLVPAVSDFICAHGGDILHADQHQAKDQGLFLMRVEGALEEFDLTPDQFPDAFAPVAQGLHMNWRIEYSEVPTRVAVFVSKEDHCLVDLLHRWRIGELRCEITMGSATTKTRGRSRTSTRAVPSCSRGYGRQARRRVKTGGSARRRIYIDLIVLARFMQILSSDFTARYPNRIINVHYS